MTTIQPQMPRKHHNQIKMPIIYKPPQLLADLKLLDVKTSPKKPISVPRADHVNWSEYNKRDPDEVVMMPDIVNN